MRMNHEPLLETRQNQLGYVLSAGEAIDSKALGVLGANIAVLIFIAQAGLWLDWWQWLLLLVPFAVSLVFDVLAIVPQNYRGNVSVSDHPEYLSMDEEDLLLQLIVDTEAAITENNKLNFMRGSWYTISIVLSVFGAAILALYLV